MKRATSVSDSMALIKALRGRGFAADLKGSKNEKVEFGLERSAQDGVCAGEAPTGCAVWRAF
jgi:hypothetical protein